MKVLIQPCMDLEEGPVACETPQADYFSVCIGEPGEYRWIADFHSDLDALNWAQEVAQLNECILEDRT